MHPTVALFIAPSTGAQGAMLRNLSFPKPDLTLYIHAGLIRIGILNLDAARLLRAGCLELEAMENAYFGSRIHHVHR